MISNRRIKVVGMALLCAVSHSIVVAQPPPISGVLADLVDLDTSVGFSVPRQITILQAFDRSKNLFFVLPNSVEFVLPQGQAGSIGLQANVARQAKGSAGSLTFTISPKVVAEDFSKAVEELKKRHPNALFAYPLPSKVQLSLSSIEQPSIVFSAQSESTPLTSAISFTTKLTSIETRFLLLPQSLESPSASFQYVYFLRGIVRDADGKPIVVERAFRLGGVLNGFCAPFPSSTVNIVTGRAGCVLVQFDRILVKEIQTLLKRSKEYVGVVDGVFGPQTDAAIRSFQKRAGLFVSGYPTRELLDSIKTKG